MRCRFSRVGLVALAVAVSAAAPHAPAVAQAARGGQPSPSPSEMVALVEAHQRALFDQVAPSVVFISVRDGFGSGFFVSATGLILTNRHVVGRRDEVQVVLHDGRTVTGTVTERAKDLDLALVQVPIEDTPAVSLATLEAVEVGSWVAAVGHGRGGIWTFNVGMVSNIYPKGEDEPLLQTQIPLNPGSSGGPVLDRRGKAVGVIVSGISDAQAINFAIPLESAMKALEGLAPHCDCLVLRAPPEATIYVNGVVAGQGPRVVIPVRQGSYEIACVNGGELHRRTIRWPAVREVDLR